MSTNSKLTSQRSRQSFLQHNTILIRTVAMLTVLGISLFFYFAAYANMALRRPSDTATTTVYFEKDGQPHDRPVDFTINCYGYHNSYQRRPHRLELFGEAPPVELVFSDSFDCPHYGCEAYIRYRFDWVQIEYCDCEGETEGRKFVIEKYSSSPTDKAKCDWTTFVDVYSNIECELTFDIADSTELTDSDTQGELTDSDGEGESTDSNTDDDKDGGCFITTLFEQ